MHHHMNIGGNEAFKVFYLNLVDFHKKREERITRTRAFFLQLFFFFFQMFNNPFGTISLKNSI